MSSATVETGTDTYAFLTKPSSNFGYDHTLNVQLNTQRAFLWLKSPVPVGATVISAHLFLYGVGNWGSSTAVTLQRVSASWTGSQLTWNSQPGTTGSTVVVTQTNPASGTPWDFDVTALLQSVANGAAYYGFRLTSGNASSTSFYSLNSIRTDWRPVLVVTWSDAPGTPHTLSPSGGRAVSIAKPILRFDYVDVSGSQGLSAVQVQIDTAGNFVTPGFDSGTVASSVPELDLTTTAYAGLSVGVSTQWRVRTQDAAGLWSGWSDPATFTRTAQPTLTLTNPAVSPNNFVSEFTPPITWTHTGTQSAWQIQIALDSDPNHPLHDTGKITGTATLAYTLPAGVLKVQGATYRVTLRIWDNVSREATPGDPTYVEVARAFFFNLSATVATVTSLTAVPSPIGLPAVVLTWNRSTAPDSFTITRDGVRVTNVLPGAVFVSGTQYSYTDLGLAPNVSHTWSVQAVVNGITSASNPTAVAQTRGSTAIWLSSPELGLLVPVVITGGASYDMPETAAVYYPVGPFAAVRVSQARRGLEGSISGRIVTYAGTASATWVANMLTFKAQPDTELYLLMGGQALRVVIGAIVLAPLDKGRAGDRACTFSFWALDPAA